tara:strand:- start:6251 stop:6370 length:120 start_codon:yes stop_codon:yes gene_type:complete
LKVLISLINNADNPFITTITADDLLTDTPPHIIKNREAL